MNDDYCLWMGDIDPRMDESIIRKLLQFYNVHPLDIKLNKNKTNKNKNYCFIYFKNIYEANNTLNQLNGKSIPNTSFKFKLNWSNYLTSENKVIFVGNLNLLVDDITLFNFFKSKYNSVLKAKIIKENGKSKKYGFVTFKKGNDYRKSLIEMNGAFLKGTNINVKEYIKKNEDENNNNNNQLNLKENIYNKQLELNNYINNSNNNVRLLNTNNINFNNFSSISNSISRCSWKNNANSINSEIICINNNNEININNNNCLFVHNEYSHNYNNNEKSNNINYNNINGNKNYNVLINNDLNNINYINNDNKNNSIINDNKTNKTKTNKFQKLEILEEFDEITLRIKINESLNKMLEYYKERKLNYGNKAVSKLNLIFNINIVSNIFKYYCNESYIFARKKNEQIN